jgi:hypothetical protein
MPGPYGNTFFLPFHTLQKLIKKLNKNRCRLHWWIRKSTAFSLFPYLPPSAHARAEIPQPAPTASLAAGWSGMMEAQVTHISAAMPSSVTPRVFAQW